MNIYPISPMFKPFTYMALGYTVPNTRPVSCSSAVHRSLLKVGGLLYGHQRSRHPPSAFHRPRKSLTLKSLYPEGRETRKREELPTLKGQLDLYIDPHAGGAFLCELSFLPLAPSEITFGHRTCTGEMTGCCRRVVHKTLTTIRVNGTSSRHRIRIHDFQPRFLFQAKGVPST